MSSRIYPFSHTLEISIDGIHSVDEVKANKIKPLKMNGGL